MTKKGRTYRLRPLFYFFGGLIALSLLLRFFVFEIYRVSKNSMNNTYFDGDRVLVNKLSKKNISRNDVVVFHQKKDVLIKRCIGLPGEVVEIRNGIFFINNSELPFPSKAILPDTAAQPGISRQQAYSVEMFDIFGKYWNLNNFGPYIVPKKGMTIQLTPENIKLYKNILADSNIPSVSTNSSYTFENDGFFLAGDNRPKSDDSRSFGAIDKTRIIGKISFVF
jgi:signal peptidase I